MLLPCIELKLIGRCFATHEVRRKMMTSKSTENTYENWTHLGTGTTKSVFLITQSHPEQTPAKAGLPAGRAGRAVNFWPAEAR